MPKEFSKAIKICEVISKYSIYILVALVPVMFLSTTSEVLDFNKQVIIVVLSFLSIFSWMIKILLAGKFSVSLSKVHVTTLVLLLVVGASTIFSLDRTGSFWGWPRITSESLLTVIGLCLVYFATSSIFSKKEIYLSVTIFVISCIVAGIYGILQLFGLHIVPLGFAKNGGFNTLGSVGGLGIIMAVLIPILSVLEIAINDKWLKIAFGVGLVVSAISLLLINFTMVWWALLVSSALFIAFGMFRRDLFDLRWLAIPIFFFVLALFFTIVNPPISAPKRPVEIYLNQATSLNIALNSIKENPVLGSGPGTFSYDFAKYKKQEFNQNIFWNLRFDSGASKAITTLATTGILGLLAFLVFMVSVIFYGVMFLASGSEWFKTKQSEKNDSALKIIVSGLFISFLAQSFAYFIYGSSISSDFLYFFLAGCIVGLISERKDFELSPSSFLTLGVTLVFTLIFIFGLGLIILEGQRYIAEFNFNRGVSAYSSGDTEKGIRLIESAIGQNQKSDIYLTNLSQIYLDQVSNILRRKDISENDTKRIQAIIANSINASRIATEINPNNVNNWSMKGFVHQRLSGLIPGAYDQAISSYEKAFELDPKNPYYVTQKGVVLLSRFYDKQTSEADKKSYLNSAKEQFEKAIQLKSDYASARFQLAMALQAQGKTDQVMPALQEAKKYAPNDVGLAFQIGLLYYQDKDYKNAQKELERAIAINENYSNALYFLALSYSAQGQNDKAILMIKKVVDLNPENQEIKKVLDNLNSGKDPLFGITQETPAKPPVEEDRPEKSKK